MPGVRMEMDSLAINSPSDKKDPKEYLGYRKIFAVITASFLEVLPRQKKGLFTNGVQIMDPMMRL